VLYGPGWLSLDTLLARWLGIGKRASAAAAENAAA
jgi:hypothetical protein